METEGQAPGLRITGCPRMLFLVMLAVVTAGVVCILQPTTFTIQYLYDDAFYYFQVANNIAHGHGSTFDQMNPTNGYHPLWMIVLVPIFAVFGGWPEIAFRAALLLQLSLWAVFTLHLFRYLAKHLSVWVWFPVLLFWVNPWFIHRQISGMDIGVALLLLSLLVVFLGRHSGLTMGMTPLRCFQLGLLMGALFLARLDTALIALVVLVFLVVRTRPRSVKSGLAYLGGAALLGGSYLSWNVYNFGHLWPVSMHVKHQAVTFSLDFVVIAWKKIFWPVYLAFDSPWAEIVIALGIIAVVALIRRTSNRRSDGVAEAHKRTDGSTETREPLDLIRHQFPLLGGVVLHWCYTCVFSPASSDGRVARDWYYAPEMVAAVLLLAAALHVLRELVRRPAIGRILSVSLGLVFVVFSTLSLVFFFGNHLRYASQVERYKAACWINDNVPHDAIVGSWDAGKIGYFSLRRVVNLDGLISSFEYVDDYLRKGRLGDWLIRNGVGYIANEYSGDSLSPITDLENEGWMVERLHEARWLQAVSNPKGKPIRRGLGVWKISPPATNGTPTRTVP